MGDFGDLVKRYWCVRMDGGRYAEASKRGGFIAIGWEELGDLSWMLEKSLKDEDALNRLKKIYRATYPNDSEVAVGLNCNQIFNFIRRIKIGDIVLTPFDRGVIIGEITSDYYYEDPPTEGCEHKNRRKVQWKKEVDRSQLSERLKSSLFAWLAIFSLDSHGAEIERLLGQIPPPIKEQYVIGSEVINVLRERLLEMPPDFFQEKLVPSLLKAMGFEAEATPTFSADGGIDVSGHFRMGVFSGNVKVQVKRVKLPIGAQIIRELRGSLKHDQQGVLITTSTFTRKAKEEGSDPSKIGKIFLVDGKRLSELIIELYDALDEEIKEELEKRFGLKRTFTMLKKSK